MGFPVKKVGISKPRELCPAENMRGLITKICYVGTIPNTFEPDKEPSEQVVFFFELDCETTDNKRHILSKAMTFSLHEKSTLSKWFQPILGDKWPKAGEPLNILDLAGISCMVSVVHYAKRDGGTGAKISSIGKLARGLSELESDSDVFIASFDDPTWDSDTRIPQWTKDMAAGNLENQSKNAPKPVVNPSSKPATNKLGFGPFSDTTRINDSDESPF
jgi:hypothetical protein